MNDNSNDHKTWLQRLFFNKFRTAFIFVVLWVLLALAAALEFGFWPKALKGRLLLLLAGPIAFLVFSVISEIFSEGFDRLPGIRHARDFIEKETEGQSFSFLRIIYRLIEILVLFAIFGGIYLAYKHW